MSWVNPSTSYANGQVLGAGDVNTITNDLQFLYNNTYGNNDTGWTNITTFSSPWANRATSGWATASFRKFNNMIFFRGIVYNPSAATTAGGTVFTMPTGYIPPYANWSFVGTNPAVTTSNNIMMWQIGSTGVVSTVNAGVAAGTLFTLNTFFYSIV